MTHLSGKETCEQCGAEGAHMNNCDRKGKRLPGLLCFQCWKATNPVMRDYKPSRCGLYLVRWFWLAFALALVLMVLGVVL